LRFSWIVLIFDNFAVDAYFLIIAAFALVVFSLELQLRLHFRLQLRPQLRLQLRLHRLLKIEVYFG